MQLSKHSTTPTDRLVSAMLESRCVLFATGSSEPPVQSVRRAEGLARLLGVPLNVLRVLPQLDRAQLLINVEDTARTSSSYRPLPEHVATRTRMQDPVMNSLN
jgi:hypothetical protein